MLPCAMTRPVSPVQIGEHDPPPLLQPTLYAASLASLDLT